MMAATLLSLFRTVACPLPAARQMQLKTKRTEGCAPYLPYAA